MEIQLLHTGTLMSPQTPQNLCESNCSICPALLSQTPSALATGSECTLTEVQLPGHAHQHITRATALPSHCCSTLCSSPKVVEMGFEQHLAVPSLCSAAGKRQRAKHQHHFLPKRKSGVFVVKKQMMDHTQPEAHEQLLEMLCWYHPPPVSTPAPGRRVIKGEQRNAGASPAHSTSGDEYLSEFPHFLFRMEKRWLWEDLIAAFQNLEGLEKGERIFI